MEGGRGGVAVDAALVKEEPDCSTFTYHMTIKEEVNLREESECASETGAGLCAGAARAVKDELELAPARVQHKHNIQPTQQPICGVLVSDGEAWLKRGGATHRQPAGTTGAEHETVPHHTVTDTLQHTAETNTSKCDTCGQIFLQKQCLIDHVKVHLREGSDTLPNASLFIFEPHLKKYSCKICKKTFRKDYLNVHARFHTGEKPFACEVCKKRFAVLDSLRVHKRIHTEERPYSCNMCAKSFARRSGLKSHRLSHTGDKAFSCEICKRRFARAGTLKSHIRTHTGEKPYCCTICNKRFTQWSALESHKRAHAGAHLYAWPLGRNYRPALDRCAVTTHRDPTGTTVAEHETVQQNTITDTLHHTTETHTYKCDTCGQIFLQKQCLIDHVKVHFREKLGTLNESIFILEPSDTDTSVKKYPCKICKIKFRKNYLKIHERFHTGEKPYTCEVCKKRFAVLGNLREHKRIHTEERPYSCNLCAKTFARSSHLKIHERSHTGEKPFKCEICNKGFSQLPNLQSHKRTHTGETPFSCTMCDKQFGQWSSLNKHKRSHTVENPYSCEITIKKSQQLGALKVHKDEKPFSCVHKHEAVSAKEKSECESSTDLCGASEMHKETRVKEVLKCESSADSCGLSETGVSVDHVIKDELELGPEGVQRRDIPTYTSRSASPRCELFATTSGASGAQQPAPPRETNTTHDTLQATTAGTRDIKQNHVTTDKQTTIKRPYTCDICTKTFTQSGSLNTHKRIHTGEKPYSCEVCNKQFTALATFNNHKITAHTQVRPYVCEICNKSFKLLASLKSHELIHAQGKPLSCDICKRQFRHKRALRVHNRIHAGVKPYSCPICKKQFRENSGLKVHVVRMHTEEKPFSCEICKKQYATKGNLKYHIGTHTSGAQQPVPPRETNTTHDTLQETTAGTRDIKQNHVTTHKQTTIKRPYTCEICNKTFTQSGSLNTHKRIHTGEKPYSCEVCNKQFTALATFNNHKITAHTQDRPYVCEICNKGFKLLASLKSHELIHAQGKPLSCDICKRQFRHKRALRVHNRIHAGVKPYSCPICKKQFRENSGLKVHVVRMHTEEKPFSCEICKKQYATKGNLKYHIGTHAKDEY